MAWYQFFTGLFDGMGVGRRNMGMQAASAGNTSSDSNISVNASSAMTLSAVFAAVKLIAESVGSLPMEAFKLANDGQRVRDTSHPLAVLFSGKVNRYQTANEYWETIGGEEALHGNAYSLISRVGTRIVSLMPLMANQMQVQLDATGAVSYRYYENGNVSIFAPENIWHLKSMGNGIVGLSPLQFGAEAVGLGLAADKRAAKFARNGFKPTGVLMLDKMLKPEQREAIRKEFADLAESQDDPLRVLEAGMTYQQVSLSPVDSQLLESRKFQLQEVARFFGVPPILLGDTNGSTVWGTGIESLVEGWYRFGLRPRLERIEASIEANLLTAAERGKYCFEFSLDALLRMNPTARAQRVKEHVQGGLLTPNEGRVEMGYPKSTDPAADSLYMQAQMVKLGTQPRGPVPTPVSATAS